MVADDPTYLNRLLKLVGQLELAILHADFPGKWKKAENAEEIKQSIVHNLRTFSIGIINEGPTASLIGTNLSSMDLPEQTAVGAIYREGTILNPRKDFSIKEGDEVIFISQGKAFKELYEKFTAETSAL